MIDFQLLDVILMINMKFLLGDFVQKLIDVNKKTKITIT
jgi:hypothetical protein